MHSGGAMLCSSGIVYHPVGSSGSGVSCSVLQTLTKLIGDKKKIFNTMYINRTINFFISILFFQPDLYFRSS